MIRLDSDGLLERTNSVSADVPVVRMDSENSISELNGSLKSDTFPKLDADFKSDVAPRLDAILKSDTSLRLDATQKLVQQLLKIKSCREKGHVDLLARFIEIHNQNPTKQNQTEFESKQQSIDSYVARACQLYSVFTNELLSFLRPNFKTIDWARRSHGASGCNVAEIFIIESFHFLSLDEWTYWFCELRGLVAVKRQEKIATAYGLNLDEVYPYAKHVSTLDEFFSLP